MKIFKNNVYLAFLTGGWLWENKVFCWLQLINITLNRKHAVCETDASTYLPFMQKLILPNVHHST